ncbi:hypothetical protein, partial [Siminovitchia fortis]|uniref:hypothetical protein n=1 Tax=Siminovitchia fortis TaxID=254758 RepID=UPI0036F38025
MEFKELREEQVGRGYEEGDDVERKLMIKGEVEKEVREGRDDVERGLVILEERIEGGEMIVW